MTTQKDFVTTNAVSSGHVTVEEQVEAPVAPTANTEVARQTAPAVTLRRRLLTTIVPVALAPLAIASAVGYTQTEAQLKEKALLQLEEVSLLTAEASEIFLTDTLKFPDLISSDPILLQAVQAGNQQVVAEGLAQKPVDAVEQQFANKLLTPNAALNSYLKRVTENADLARVVVTSKDGFNVGFSRPTDTFVQNEKVWWQQAKANGQAIEEPRLDQVTGEPVLGVAKQIKDVAGNMIGVMEITLPTTELDEAISKLIIPNLTETEIVQIVDPRLETNQVVDTISAEGSDTENQDITGGADILTAANLLEDYIEAESGDLNATKAQISNIDGMKDVTLTEREAGEFKLVFAAFTDQGRFYNLSIVPNTKLVAIASVSTAEEAAVARNQLLLFAIIGLLLGAVVVAVIFWLSNTVSQPLTDLTGVADEAAEGNLEVQAKEQGTIETRTLARTFNTMVAEVKDLLGKQEQATKEQKEARDKLEMEIYQLLDEVGDAVDGDLTVRASLSSMEMSTVADLFNAIIDNLKDIAEQVKDSSVKVNSSLDENGNAVQTLADQAIQETERTRDTLSSIEQMSMSIANVSANASKAATISDEAYATVQEGSTAMDQTVDSILGLRNTVGETSKKIKRLGESSQKISQVVSLIEEIALKTNLLAINASVEASRAGEQGQGFTVVAEQVGALAEQSAAATKEIAQIVAGIQAETKEVTEAMEVGTTQVVDSTRLVEDTKTKLADVLNRSQEINTLMQSISEATTTQTETSRTVTDLMTEMALLSELRSESSTQVAKSMQDTATIAQKLEAAVAQFKLEEKTAG
ncbi:Methyl-accepting chemotaxis protein PctC [Acaryochloris thomasi RCC1774]|uniref:Methyl-accepting chemotaxis protein PctC n=1 Tax=Acaryochloris thomasi RCC1774 TaxID=1764569 RepID=A0A2W1JJJ3_9CYAN|nr:methyl-accepting chemotaxis protein [Acaryochloris thomasi]PZD73406.1 Methyl-accepting chemotaxis protein PctC [Acaryochloris thomasi RCC1774]